jgi:YD repeat-containing protein
MGFRLLIGMLLLFCGTAAASFYHQGLVTKATGPYGRLFEVVYDGYDRPITNIDAGGIAVGLGYDPLGRVQFRYYPDGSYEEFVYSSNGLAAYYDPGGRRTDYGYDAAGRSTHLQHKVSRDHQGLSR